MSCGEVHPFQKGSLPALLLVKPELLFAIGPGGAGLAQVLTQGAQLRAREVVPGEARLELVGTPAVLSRLKSKGVRFVDRLVEEVTR